LWKEVIRSKYGEEVIDPQGVVWAEGCQPWFSSLWWKDLCSTGFNLDTNWFSRRVNKIVGNGANTRFLIGNLPLKECFPRVFSIYTQKEASVADLWSGAGLEWGRRTSLEFYLA
jgi:hypothetical protein